MKNLFEPQTTEEIKGRVAQLRPDSERLWGSMTVAQTVEHCCRGMESATGDRLVPRVFVGRILGPIVKPMALGNDKPMRRNSPTAPAFVVKGEPEFATERERLLVLIDRFVAAGAAGCTKHPHAFFGKLKPEEWAELMYKHLDHHLRQFGV
jgi:Protein of unknown function (DUF1569)